MGTNNLHIISSEFLFCDNGYFMIICREAIGVNIKFSIWASP